jgi:hypothetical protein
MKKWAVVALLMTGAAILGATVLSEPIATAAQSVTATIAGPLDGQGNVKVHEQGTATVSGTVASRPAAPSSTWSASEATGGQAFWVAGPSTEIDVTSLSASHVTSDPAPSSVLLVADSVSDSTSECNSTTIDPGPTVWHIDQVADPFSVSFPSPLRLTAPAGKKVCLRLNNTTGGPVQVNVSGFYGT